MGASGLRNAALVLVVTAAALLMVAVSPCRADLAQHFAVLVNDAQQQSYFLQDSKPAPFRNAAFNNATHVDIGGHRFYSRNFNGRRVVLVKAGSGLTNTALAAQLLLSLFPGLRLLVHAGFAGTPTPNKLDIADIVVVDQLVNTGNLYWQGVGQNSEPGVAKLTIDDYNLGVVPPIYPPPQCLRVTNLLNKIWYLKQEVVYSFDNSQNLLVFNFTTDIAVPDIDLERCAKIPGEGKKCLQKAPEIVKWGKTCSSDSYVANQAYALFLNNAFGCDNIDTASAGVALVCESYKRRCASVKAISNTAGVYTENSGDNAQLVTKLNRKNLVEVTIAIIDREIEPRLSMVV